ncbi:MAG TPA: NAD(P)-binding domain-containing protein [Cyclobacteriaceae bacterium]|nr:NAD(P)-binding domain-containing protein [Cyclobacteriaceae bacterium]HMV08834.1 NAD(P)-binding domain-containing protein [Cyclobacteriaceae bacterium]HMV90768.1 NAD(P)-binding domain-containing protein [Cyclobacteriaceae bacterium]HMW99980.1 NAD(P)-binding domain-containing protein [Cyclobacteriaceae bacterium]HMX49157.1 NAD(P)-binding domain-containing protein [Cyclobacteriaceae bacterium]
MSKKKIGLIGSGTVSQVLASGFLKHGYDVMIGTRDTSKLAAWHSKNSAAKVGSFEDTAAFGEIVVLAVKGTVAEKLAISLKPQLTGKTVIDTTNPIAEAPPVNGVLKFFTTHDESLLERLQRAVPDANFVKSFSCVGNSLMIDPNMKDGKPTMFICGNNAGARATVSGILSEFNWDVADMGTAEAARAIEPLCMLWCIPGFINNSWGHAFKLLKS